jgi:hypothetical protein
VTAAQALAAIRGYATAGRYVITVHAARRMRERGCTDRDVRRALSLASACTLQPDDHWRVSGPDLDGDDLVCIVVFEDGVVVVTLF